MTWASQGPPLRGVGSPRRAPENSSHVEVFLRVSRSPVEENSAENSFVRPDSNPAHDADEFQPGLAGTSAGKVKESIRFPAQKLMR